MIRGSLVKRITRNEVHSLNDSWHEGVSIHLHLQQVA